MGTKAMSDEERIVAIEIQLADQEQTITELSDLAKAQWDEIDALKAQVRSLRERLADAQGQTHDPDATVLTPTQIAARDKPPHY